MQYCLKKIWYLWVQGSPELDPKNSDSREPTDTSHWKKYNDHTYSCPRGWQLSASIKEPLDTPRISVENGTEGTKVNPELNTHYADRHDECLLQIQEYKISPK